MLLAVVSWPAKRKMKELPRISGRPIVGEILEVLLLLLLSSEGRMSLAVIRGTRV